MVKHGGFEHVKRVAGSCSIPKLLSQIETNELCLPSFQRDFVWTPDQMAMLIDSIIRQYPTGTIMLLKREHNMTFGKRSFVETDQNAFEPTYYVIDGQQRLKTIYDLLKSPSEFKPKPPIPYYNSKKRERNGKNYKIFLYVDANLDRAQILDTPDEKNERIVEAIQAEGEVNDYERSDLRRIMPIDDYKKQGKKHMMPIEFLLNNKLTEKWLGKAFARNNHNVARYRRKIHKMAKIVGSYECMTELIETKLKPQDHYNMFQLLNEAGTDLTIFDLLVARMSPLKINLRSLWKDANVSYASIKKFDIDPVYILKVVALIRATKNNVPIPTCNKNDLMKLYKHYDPEKGGIDFKNDWYDACEALQNCLLDMESEFGVCKRKYIPYFPMIITYAIVKWWWKEKGYHQKFKKRAQARLRHWYWGAIFNREYDSRTDNKISEHYSALRQWLTPGHRVNIPSEINFKFTRTDIEDSIDDIESAADARYNAILCLPIISSARDIYSDELLTNAVLHDHHFYPKGFLNDQKIVETSPNWIVNRMLITDKTNLEIKKRDPVEYLNGIKRDALRRHFIPKGIVSSQMTFNDFCKKRKKLIVDRLLELLN